jgi:hypothetical protein
VITPSNLEKIPIELERYMSDLEIHIMEDVIRRIKINDEVTRSADWQIYRLTQIAEHDKQVKAYIQHALKLSQAQIDTIYNDAIESGYTRDKSLYEATSKKFTPFVENQELQQLIQSVITQTNKDMTNITQTLGFSVDMGNRTVFTPLSQLLQNTLDNAMIDVLSGTFDYNSTLKKVVNQMTKSGLRTVDYSTGWTNRVEVAARRALMTGITQVTSKINDTNAETLGTDYFEVSWHATARPSHQVWQGRVYSRSELESVCGLGSGSGLCGWNCYHTYYPFIPDVSERTYTDKQLDEMNTKENEPKTYNDREYTTYEASQKQRNLETLMRKQRTDIKLLEKAGASEDNIINAKCRYRSTMAQYADFSKKMDLPQQKERIYMDGLGKVGGNKGIAKPPKSDIIKSDKQFGKKIGKHTKEYGLDPGKETDRNKMSRIIDDIINNVDEKVSGEWRGQPGLSDFYIKGEDVVVVNNNKFVTILKGGIENARVKNARE